MELVLYDIEPFRAFFDLIYDSANTVELKLDSEKLSISLLNNSHICFYQAEYDKEFFDTYSVDTVESVSIFVEDFYKILKSATKDDVLTISSDEQYLRCVFEHDFNRRVFELPLAEESYESPQPPKIDYDDGFFLKISSLKAPLNDLDKICKTDRFRMTVNDSTLHITSPEDSMTRYSQSIEIDTNLVADAVVNKQYIEDILKLVKIGKDVEFKLGNDIPVTYNVQDQFDCIRITGLIAPVIQEE